MYKMPLLTFIVAILFSQQVNAQTKDIIKTEIIGKWKWSKLVSYGQKGEKIYQKKYTPGYDADNYRVFSDDHIFQDITVGNLSKNMIEKGTWSVKNDTLIMNYKNATIVTTFSIAQNKMFLQYVKIIKKNSLTDYSKQKNKTTEEYIKAGK